MDRNDGERSIDQWNGAVSVDEELEVDSTVGENEQIRFLCDRHLLPRQSTLRKTPEACRARSEMANRGLARRNPEPEVNDAIWEELPEELVEKCLGNLPVLTIASKLREVNKAWRDYAGTLPFMLLHNHGKNQNSSFGFLMYCTNPSTNRCETMILNHEARKWQMAPSLELHGQYRTCEVESVSEGLLLLSALSLRPIGSRSFIVWNPLLRCEQAVPEIPQDYTNVNLVVDRAAGSFKIVAFSASFRECFTYSPTTSSWQSVNHHVHNGLEFPQTGYGSGYIAIAYKICVYVAVESSREDDVREVGDLCYDLERNVWKPAVMCRVPPATERLYVYCFTRSLLVVNDVMYMVLECHAGFDRMGNDRPHPTVQILARSLAPAGAWAVCAGAWAVIASTVLPHSDWETKWVGSWYACTLEGHEKPTICALFIIKTEREGPLYMMMYDIGMSTWKKVGVTDNSQSEVDYDGIMRRYVDARTMNERQLSLIERKWKAMRMVLHYTPSWICPAAECTHHHSPRHGGAHVGAV